MATISPTLAINEEIARRTAAGLDTVPLGFGEANVPVHPALVRRLADSAARNQYGPVAGSAALLEAAAGYWDRRALPTGPAQVVSGPGSKPLLYALFQALGGPVALPKPSWVSYAAQARLLGIDAHLVPTGPSEGGVPDPDRLDALARECAADVPLRAVLVTLPDNPTGTLASPETIGELCAAARRHDLTIISDEIYRDLVHDAAATYVSAADLAPERTIITSGLSKSLALGGWRIGVARFPADPAYAEVRATVLTAASEIWSAAPQPVQSAAAWAYGEPAELVDHIARGRRLHGAIARASASVFARHGAHVPEPVGGFYVYPSFDSMREQLRDRWSITTSAGLASTLLDRFGVATLPGAAFGDDPERLTLRVATSMLNGGDDSERTRALESEDPTTLPWVARRLDQLAAALSALT
ncbi:pyridoxal phosphate-dependent aminotransferase [Solicola gregarius]|uniref:Aminotransferase n=1 Tax=Solicola gregarius TaxID=2908642 RepID=A0AA46TIR8_9ACTN|nr:pyridoxal phosphate-dependent aminotransferase [Solicola gregarius]UYM05961.1 pyridoxal phosphate-dependent aminotransferase [Solicola gregarius]